MYGSRSAVGTQDKGGIGVGEWGFTGSGIDVESGTTAVRGFPA